MKVKIAIKSIVLIILIVLSILQIEKLWFENSSSHNFFNYIPKNRKPVSALQELILEPEHIAIYRGKVKGEYRILDTAGILYNSVFKDTGKLIKQFPQMQTIAKYKYEDLFQRPHILYSFAVPISKTLIYNIAEKIPSGEDENITGMAILPAGLEESRFGVMFFNEKAELVVGFTIPKVEVQEENEIFTQYVNSQAIATEIQLLSARQKGLADFQGEVLLPSEKQNYILPLEWKQEVAFLDKNENEVSINAEKLVEYLSSFTTNPKILWSMEQSDKSRYGDSSVIMEYNTKGVFSYRYIQPLEKEQELPLGEELKIAADFMEKDNLISSQEIKLTAIEKRQNQICFYYDYYYRGYPLLWTAELVKQYGVKYPMKIVIEGNRVVEYHRVMLQSDYLLQQGNRFRVNYQDALNRFYQSQENMEVKNLYLGYFAEEKTIKLGWIVEAAQARFYYPLGIEGVANELE